MVRLGEILSEQSRKSAQKGLLSVGSVLRHFVEDTTPPKVKRMIIMSINQHKNKVATIYLNSEINPQIFHDEKSRIAHVFLTKNGRPYIDKDCYASCTGLILREISLLEGWLNEGKKVYLGEVSQSDLEILKSTIKKSKTITNSIKKKYGLFY